MEKQEKVELPTERFGESGNVLILVGGTASDRDLAARIMGFQGKKLDLGQLEEQVRLNKEFSLKMHWPFYTRYGRSIKEMSLENPEDVKTLHDFCEKLGLDEAGKRQFFENINRRLLKPNIMLGSEGDLRRAIETCSITEAGYDRDMIHIAWILNDHDVVKKPNPASVRKTVEEDLARAAYSGAANPFVDVLSHAYSLTDIWSELPTVHGAMWIFFSHTGADAVKMNAIQIKEAEKPIPDSPAVMDMKVAAFAADGQLLTGDQVVFGDMIEGYVYFRDDIDVAAEVASTLAWAFQLGYGATKSVRIAYRQLEKGEVVDHPAFASIWTKELAGRGLDELADKYIHL